MICDVVNRVFSSMLKIFTGPLACSTDEIGAEITEQPTRYKGKTTLARLFAKAAKRQSIITKSWVVLLAMSPAALALLKALLATFPATFLVARFKVLFELLLTALGGLTP